MSTKDRSSLVFDPTPRARWAMTGIYLTAVSLHARLPPEALRPPHAAPPTTLLLSSAWTQVSFLRGPRCLFCVDPGIVSALTQVSFLCEPRFFSAWTEVHALSLSVSVALSLPTFPPLFVSPQLS